MYNMGRPKNIRTMYVQACQSADLSFAVPGVIGKQNFCHDRREGLAFLGQRVTAFNMAEVYAKLRSPAQPQQARLSFSSVEIEKIFENTKDDDGVARYLFALRNESLAATLDQSVEQRTTAFHDKYRHAVELQENSQTYLRNANSSLKRLDKRLDQRRTDVYKFIRDKESLKTSCLAKTDSTSSVILMASANLDKDGVFLEQNLVKLVEGDDASHPAFQTQKSDRTGSVPMMQDDKGAWTIPSKIFPSQTTETNTIVHPAKDFSIAHYQSKSAVAKERLQVENAVQRAKTMADAMSAELRAIDAGIRHLQINFAHTYLVSPINGIITAVYKDIGEYVESGEAVCRVENDSVVLFVGTLHSRKPLLVGRKLKLKIGSIFEDPERGQCLDAVIRAVRGHSADNDEWDIIAEAPNPQVDFADKDQPPDIRPLFPLNYHLDPDTDWFDL